MRKTKYIVKPTTQFKKDYKLAMKRGLRMELLENVIAALAMDEPLPEKNKDHALTGNWVDTVNVIFNRTGCWSIVLRTMSLC